MNYTKYILDLLDQLLLFDIDQLKDEVAALKQRHPRMGNKALTKMIFKKARKEAMVAGVTAGMISNPLATLPLITADIALTLRLEMIATAKVALLYDPDFFGEQNARWRLMIPLLGINFFSQVGQKLTVKGVMGLTGFAIKKLFSGKLPGGVEKLLLKYFGIKITQKELITRTVPVIGGIVGGAWNWVEVSKLRDRVVAYFEGTPLEKAGEPEILPEK